jgi:hypothetical protein
MHARTIARIHELEKASWFSRVGIAAAPLVATVSSWPEAIEYCIAPEWEDLRLDMINEYRVHIHRNHWERLQGWNEIILEIQKITAPLVDRKIESVVQRVKPPRIFRAGIRSDVDLFCMEAEYDDICPPGFFARLGAWYLDGHFPCGWSGPFPEGKLIVY